MASDQVESLQPKRWQKITPEQRRAEFEALLRSPYWEFLPDEIQELIKNLPYNDENDFSKKD